LYGFRYSFGFAIIVWLLSFTVGICAGALMGFSGGWVDLIGQRVVEVFESLPFLILLITLVSIFGASMPLLVIFLSCFGWITISYYVRAEFLKLRRLDFVEAAKAIGGNKVRQVFKHILPNALGPVITFSPFVIAANISTLSVLDFLGFGLPPPTPSWGELFQQAQRHVTEAWWLAVYPALALFISIMVMNLIGDGVRDALDPRK
jgi:microcin C transport system permease protein